MRALATLLVLTIMSLQLDAQKIFGTVYNEKGDLLPFSSITIKGTSLGTSANNKGKFSFALGAGSYTLVCQHIGFTAAEKKVTVTEDLEVTFILSEQKLTMNEVVVKSGGEDPAYAIIRQAIKKRTFYNKQVDDFTCELYGKDLIKMRKMPSSFFGRKIPAEDRKEMGLDSTGKGILYLSESMSKISIAKPDKYKLEVMSSRVSGSDGFGFTFPAFITLYTNNVTVFSGTFNPRGFISPISDGALNYYKFKFLGSFYENGKAVNSIKVTPRRKYEPLFSGVINITDDDWRIHSFDLLLTKSSQLELLDTLQITQLHVPVSENVWRVKSQLLYFNFSQFKIDAIGNFLTVYSNYDIKPTFPKKFFDNIVIKYDTAVNKKTVQYWDSIRPVPLEIEELKDYHLKDSINKAEKDSLLTRNSIDSLKKRQGKIKVAGIFLSGINRTRYSLTNQFKWGIDPLLWGLEYNTVEGTVMNLSGYYEKYFKRSKYNLSIMPMVRYGFSNTHLNAFVDIELKKRDFSNDQKIKRETWTLSGGKRVSQFNKENPVFPLRNSILTLFYGENYLKIYENYFGTLGFSKRYENGLRLGISAVFEDRIPLENTTDYTFAKKSDIKFTPNFPTDRPLDTVQFSRHQAMAIDFQISFKPGQRYIQLPYSKVPIGSKYPTFTLGYTKGIPDILGSDVNYDKWKLGVSDDRNLKLAGTFKYRLAVGGFLNTNRVFIQDYTHFLGNQSKLSAGEYLRSFQLAKYYQNSNTASFYSQVHIEHHFNGLLTNKIPLFKRLNWNLVAGTNTFYVNRDNNYTEFFVGLENVLKVFRVDFVVAYENGRRGMAEIKVGGGGLLGGGLSASPSGRRRGGSIDLSF